MKKVLALMMASILTLGLVSCDFLDDEDDDRYGGGGGSNQQSGSSSSSSDYTFAASNGNTSDITSTVVDTYSGNGTYSGTDNSNVEWVMYWYLCGSDLETYYGSATDDLNELMSVSLPSNVQVVIQTGGAEDWQNSYVDSNKVQRYLYSSSGLQLVDEQSNANMGATDTLIDFLTFATENYPANHTIINFWNHGGGSVSGVIFDENYNYDSLTLDELYIAFASVFEANPTDPVVDIVGFDACLMATIDTAYTMADFCHYMVASEEWEPSCGWYYTGFMGDLAKNSSMSALDVAISICDSYVEGCEAERSGDDITLSVVDLTQMDSLVSAYNDFGNEALSLALENTSFFTEFAKAASSSENYGGNSRQDGYTNMVDLGDLVSNSSSLMTSTSSALLSALDSAVAYTVNGKYCPNASGLACYYSYSGDIDDFNSYVEIGAGDAFKYLYSYSLTGKLPENDYSYLDQVEFIDSDLTDYSNQGLPQIQTVDVMGWEDIALTVDRNACATMTLGPEAYDVLASVTFELYYADAREDILLCLGEDNDIIADWDNGIFKDNFRGVWGSIDGNLCYMELAYEGDDYNRYAVPILLNGEKYNLSVIYDFTREVWSIEGARKPLDESGAADKNLRHLMVGDEIQTLHYATTLSGDDTELMEVPVDTIIVTEKTSFYEVDLGDGYFYWVFIMTDSQGNFSSSQVATFEIRRGEIYTSVE